LRNKLSQTMVNFENHQQSQIYQSGEQPKHSSFLMDFKNNFPSVHASKPAFFETLSKPLPENTSTSDNIEYDRPLGRVIGQYGKKYIIAESNQGLVIIDQHAAHERIVYEQLRNHNIKVQPLLTPIVVNLKPEQVSAVLEVKDELKTSGLVLDQFGDTSIAIFEKPADWDLNWVRLLGDISDEVLVNGHSSQLHEKLHLKLANYACHHSVRAGQRLDYAQMDALLRDIETTERAGQCNHGRPVYKIIKMSDLDSIFERI